MFYFKIELPVEIVKNLILAQFTTPEFHIHVKEHSPNAFFRQSRKVYSYQHMSSVAWYNQTNVDKSGCRLKTL